MNEEIKEVNILKPSIEPKERWFKLFWSAKGTPKQVAKKGLIIMLTAFILSYVFSGPFESIFDIFVAYGQILLFIALFKWIKNKRSLKKQQIVQ